MNKNFLITESQEYSKKALELYAKNGNLYLEKGIKDELVDILVVRLGNYLDSNFLDRFTRLSYIISPTTGLTHIDNDYCLSRNIKIISLNNIKNEIKSVSSTAELTLGLIIAITRRIPQAVNDVNNGNWNRDKFKSFQLKDKQLGIIGYGRIGQMVGSYAEALGMKVGYFDKNKNLEIKNKTTSATKMTLSKILATSDILSLHIDSSQNNNNFLNFEKLNQLKKGALLINTARGNLVDESKIIHLLKENTLSGYAADVINFEEDFSPKSPIISNMKKLNIIITPHIGGCTKEAMHLTEDAMAKFFCETCLRK